jgi:hypothetical protein
MADVQTHTELSKRLLGAMREAHARAQWPVVVDAGFYTVFHGMEALNATECRDSYTFADAVDILERVLAPRFLGEAFVRDYEFLFYFRRGAIYGTHVPTGKQIARYIETAERAQRHVMAAVAQVSTEE